MLSQTLLNTAAAVVPAIPRNPAAVAPALGYTAGGIGIGKLAPQMWRTLRHGKVDGLSRATWSLGIATALSWLTYGLLRGEHEQVWINSIFMTGSALLLTALVRQRPWPVGRPVALALAATAGWVALLATAAWFGGSLTIGVIATICATVAAWPQVRTLRDRSVDPAGVSPAMWWLGLTSSTLWTLYGLLVSSVPITVCSLVNLILGIAVLVSLRRLNRRSWTVVRLAAA